MADTGSGHNIVKTLFVECGAGYSHRAPDPMAPVDETRFVAAAAAEQLDWYPDRAPIAGRSPAGLADDPAFQAGVRRLGERHLTYDSWHYHHQNREFLTVARAAPETTMVLDHFGTPLGVGRFAGKHDEIFPTWCEDMREIAACENVVAKLGGLAMPDNGFGYERMAQPGSSDRILADQRRWYEHMIECFGPDRCMFESNFPVDKMSASYTVVWNVFQKLVAGFSDDEQTAMFSGTARQVYSL